MRPSSKIPPFTPHICGPAGNETYEDGRVTGSIGIEGSTLVIYEWNSAFPSQGHTKMALQWLRLRYPTIIASGVGTIEASIGDIATYYWNHMRELRLVDKIFDDHGVEITQGDLRV